MFNFGGTIFVLCLLSHPSVKERCSVAGLAYLFHLCCPLWQSMSSCHHKLSQECLSVSKGATEEQEPGEFLLHGAKKAQPYSGVSQTLNTVMTLCFQLLPWEVRVQHFKLPGLYNQKFHLRNVKIELKIICATTYLFLKVPLKVIFRLLYSFHLKGISLMLVLLAIFLGAGFSHVL